MILKDVERLFLSSDSEKGAFGFSNSLLSADSEGPSLPLLTPFLRIVFLVPVFTVRPTMCLAPRHILVKMWPISRRCSWNVLSQTIIVLLICACVGGSFATSDLSQMGELESLKCLFSNTLVKMCPFIAAVVFKAPISCRKKWHKSDFYSLIKDPCRIFYERKWHKVASSLTRIIFKCFTKTIHGWCFFKHPSRN